MPNYENNYFHGHLIITIDVQLPKNYFSEQNKEVDNIILYILP